jgi:hypothetical protein
MENIMMTTNYINAEDIDKDFEKDQGPGNCHQYPNPTPNSLEDLLDLMRQLAIPGSEVNTHQLFVELMWTGCLQEFLNYANRNIFKSFQLHLKMD